MWHWRNLKVSETGEHDDGNIPDLHNAICGMNWLRHVSVVPGTSVSLQRC